MLEKIFILLLFGVIGLGMEVIFTSLSSLFKKDKRDIVRIFGYSSLWYFPLYAIVLPLGIHFLQPLVESLPLFSRGIIYAILIQLGEFIAMWSLHLLNGQSPSEKEYLASKRSISGFTRWDFFPAFILLSLVFEYLVMNLFAF